MMEELNYTQEQVAERMGKDRSSVTNYIRLLKLPPDILSAVRNNSLSMGHARALVNIDTVDKQLFVFKEIQQKELSVRQTEELVRKLYKADLDQPRLRLNQIYRLLTKKLKNNWQRILALKLK
jgi:ParB family chromosome partitioning protein